MVMTPLLTWIGLATGTIAAPAAALDAPTVVAFEKAVVADPGHADLEVGIWYPGEGATAAKHIGFVQQDIAVTGDPAPGRHPLILISHGNGGLYTSHADTAFALAAQGFVVAAVTHTGANARDTSAVGSADWLIDRPRHIRLTLDHVLTQWRGGDRIVPEQIGVFGFSMGGFTALALLGGTPDLRKAVDYCRRHASEFTCAQGFGDAVAAWPRIPDATAWPRDRRIRAAVIAAPAMGFLQDPKKLAAIRLPIQLWVTPVDEVVPMRTSVEMIRDQLGAWPDFHRVRNASHYDFLTPCDAGISGRLRPTTPAIDTLAMCGTHGGFDRAAFHRVFNAEISAFFRRTLSP